MPLVVAVVTGGAAGRFLFRSLQVYLETVDLDERTAGNGSTEEVV
jgi:hypothetical protein